MATIFPSNPAVGQTYESNSIRWRWSGVVWALFTDPAVVFDHTHDYDGDIITTGMASQIAFDGGDADPA
jgi:hypothetical protein